MRKPRLTAAMRVKLCDLAAFAAEECQVSNDDAAKESIWQAADWIENYCEWHRQQSEKRKSQEAENAENQA